MNPEIPPLIEKLEKLASNNVIDVMAPTRQLPIIAKVLALVAGDQEKSAAKMERQTTELIGMTGQLVSMTKRIVLLTRVLVWLTFVVVIFTIVLFWFAFVQTQILKRDEQLHQVPQHIEQADKDQPQSTHYDVKPMNQ